jgi:hypothetical protein
MHPSKVNNRVVSVNDSNWHTLKQHNSSLIPSWLLDLHVGTVPWMTARRRGATYLRISTRSRQFSVNVAFQEKETWTEETFFLDSPTSGPGAPLMHHHVVRCTAIHQVLAIHLFND